MRDGSPMAVLDMNSLEEVGGYLGGSYPGKTVESSSGNRFYAKCPVNPEQVWTEVFAGRIYEMAGIAAAKTHAGTDGKNWWVLSEWVDHETDVLTRMDGPDDSPWLTEVFRGFAVDAWLGNYDVVGDVYTNLVTVADMPFRLDNGASLYTTARGREKHWWSEEPTDLVDMREGADYSWAYAMTADLFGRMTDEQLEWSVWSTLFPLEEGSIELLVDEFGRSLRKGTLDTLLIRKRYIENQILR